jgi:hypothetical protein
MQMYGRKPTLMIRSHQQLSLTVKRRKGEKATEIVSSGLSISGQNVNDNFVFRLLFFLIFLRHDTAYKKDS